MKAEVLISFRDRDDFSRVYEKGQTLDMDEARISHIVGLGLARPLETLPETEEKPEEAPAETEAAPEDAPEADKPEEIQGDIFADAVAKRRGRKPKNETAEK